MVHLQVYNAPDGKKVLASGTPSGQYVAVHKSTTIGARNFSSTQVRRDVLTRSSLDVTVVSNAVDPSNKWTNLLNSILRRHEPLQPLPLGAEVHPDRRHVALQRHQTGLGAGRLGDVPRPC